MQYTAYRILLLALAIASASPSEACRLYLPPERRIAHGYEREAIASVAVVRVTDSNYVGPPEGDAHPWRASALVEQVISGSIQRKRVTFTRGHGSAACDDGRPLPKRGERWVIYFWKPATGDYQIWQSYPAAVAMNADARLRAMLVR